MILSGADRLLDQFDRILRELRGFGGNVDIVPAFVGIDDEASFRRTAVDGGDPLMVILARQFQFQQLLAVERRLARLRFHDLRFTE